jgi:hypothetical protein
MNRSSELASVSEVIAAFGGPSAMARIFGGFPSRFCNYRAKAAFPPNMHMRVYCECVKRGLTVAPELVGMDAEAARLLKVKTPDRQLRLLALAAE